VQGAIDDRANILLVDWLGDMRWHVREAYPITARRRQVGSVVTVSCQAEISWFESGFVADKVHFRRILLLKYGTQLRL
jgi:outer membrane biosynthesis protein TonB